MILSGHDKFLQYFHQIFSALCSSQTNPVFNHQVHSKRIQRRKRQHCTAETYHPDGERQLHNRDRPKQKHNPLSRPRRIRQNRQHHHRPQRAIPGKNHSVLVYLIKYFVIFKIISFLVFHRFSIQSLDDALVVNHFVYFAPLDRHAPLTYLIPLIT